MKRLLPILGIFLITTLMGCSNEGANKLPPPNDEEKKILYALRNPHIYIEDIDDFDNSITWTKSLSSKNKYPTDNDAYRFNDDPKISATLYIRCTKYANNSRKYVLEFNPPISITYGVKRLFKVDMKWDDMQREIKYLSSKSFYSGHMGGKFSDAENIIKKLDKHSKLKIRYEPFLKETQIVEFSLDKLERRENKDLSELVTKCSGAEY